MTPTEVKELNKGRFTFKKEHTSTKSKPYRRLPGHVLVEEFLVPYGADLSSLSYRARIPVVQLHKLIRGQYRIDKRIADALANAFNNTPEYWLKLQEDFEKGIAL